MSESENTTGTVKQKALSSNPVLWRLTDPEFSRVGPSEKQTQNHGVPYRWFKIPMEGVLRARTVSERRRFLKALVEINGWSNPGFTPFGVDGGRSCPRFKLQWIAELPYTKLRDPVLTQPTFMECLITLFASAPSGVARTASAGA